MHHVIEILIDMVLHCVVQAAYKIFFDTSEHCRVFLHHGELCAAYCFLAAIEKNE